MASALFKKPAIATFGVQQKQKNFPIPKPKEIKSDHPAFDSEDDSGEDVGNEEWGTKEPLAPPPRIMSRVGGLPGSPARSLRVSPFPVVNKSKIASTIQPIPPPAVVQPPQVIPANPPPKLATTALEEQSILQPVIPLGPISPQQYATQYSPVPPALGSPIYIPPPFTYTNAAQENITQQSNFNNGAVKKDSPPSNPVSITQKEVDVKAPQLLPPSAAKETLSQQLSNSPKLPQVQLRKASHSSASSDALVTPDEDAAIDDAFVIEVPRGMSGQGSDIGDVQSTPGVDLLPSQTFDNHDSGSEVDDDEDSMFDDDDDAQFTMVNPVTINSNVPPSLLTGAIKTAPLASPTAFPQTPDFDDTFSPVDRSKSQAFPVFNGMDVVEEDPVEESEVVEETVDEPELVVADEPVEDEPVEDEPMDEEYENDQEILSSVASSVSDIGDFVFQSAKRGEVQQEDEGLAYGDDLAPETFNEEVYNNEGEVVDATEVEQPVVEERQVVEEEPQPLPSPTIDIEQASPIDGDSDRESFKVSTKPIRSAYTSVASFVQPTIVDPKPNHPPLPKSTAPTSRPQESTEVVYRGESPAMAPSLPLSKPSSATPSPRSFQQRPLYPTNNSNSPRQVPSNLTQEIRAHTVQLQPGLSPRISERASPFSSTDLFTPQKQYYGNPSPTMAQVPVSSSTQNNTGRATAPRPFTPEFNGRSSPSLSAAQNRTYSPPSNLRQEVSLANEITPTAPSLNAEASVNRAVMPPQEPSYFGQPTVVNNGSPPAPAPAPQNGTYTQVTPPRMWPFVQTMPQFPNPGPSTPQRDNMFQGGNSVGSMPSPHIMYRHERMDSTASLPAMQQSPWNKNGRNRASSVTSQMRSLGPSVPAPPPVFEIVGPQTTTQAPPHPLRTAYNGSTPELSLMSRSVATDSVALEPIDQPTKRKGKGLSKIMLSLFKVGGSKKSKASKVQDSLNTIGERDSMASFGESSRKDSASGFSPAPWAKTANNIQYNAFNTAPRQPWTQSGPRPSIDSFGPAARSQSTSAIPSQTRQDSFGAPAPAPAPTKAPLPPFVHHPSIPIVSHIPAISLRLQAELDRDENTLGVVDQIKPTQIIETLVWLNARLGEVCQLIAEAVTQEQEQELRFRIEQDCRTKLNGFLEALVFKPFSVRLSVEDDMKLRSAHSEIFARLPHQFSSKWRILACISTAPPPEQIEKISDELTNQCLSTMIDNYNPPLRQDLAQRLQPLMTGCLNLAKILHGMTGHDYHIFCGTPIGAMANLEQEDGLDAFTPSSGGVVLAHWSLGLWRERYEGESPNRKIVVNVGLKPRVVLQS